MIGHIGSKYTWSNNREERGFTKERLDIAMGNGFWPLQFRNTEVSVLSALNSDHAPLLITCDNEEDGLNRKIRLFRYEAFWCSKQECKDIIKRSWQASGREVHPLRKIQYGLVRCKQALKAGQKFLMVNRD